MNREQAKEILSAYRPGSEDAHDPIFKEARELARHDAELRAWFESSTAFDQEMRGQIARVTAPDGLLDAILTARKIIRPQPWWHSKLSGRQLAAAAAVIIAGALVTLWIGQRPAGFGESRREIAERSWGPAQHLGSKVTTLDEVRRILAAQNVGTNFVVPPVLAQSEVRGCSVMLWRGHDIPVLCFKSTNQHLHLIVMDRNLFPDSPSQVPQTDQWQVWRTASWSKDEHTYVLTGLSTSAFVKKFRKDRHWDWEG